MKFFIGLHMPSHAKRFDRCMISVNRLRNRKGGFEVFEWMMDSGAFTEVTTYGCYRHSVEEYAAQINRWQYNGRMLAAVAQDYMCEPFVLEKTGLTIADHQRLTIERYDALLPLCPCVYILPVLQGWTPADYVDHCRQYGPRLARGAWVGVGSVCKRNSSPRMIQDIVLAIKTARPDLDLHLFGVKLTSLGSDIVRDNIYSSDSMSWSLHGRMRGGGNDPLAAVRYARRVKNQAIQTTFPAFIAGALP